MIVLARVVTTSPLTVRQFNLPTRPGVTELQAVRAKTLSSYTPVQNDVVAIEPVAGTVLILGKVV